jgi:branched-chain amino acid transport system permease protein
MELFVLNVLNGISFGMLLFFIASGLALVFGVMGILNLAHGAFYMIGAYVGIVVTRACGSWLFGLLSAAACVAVIGFALERVFLRHLYKQLNEQVLLTVGAIYILTNIVQWLWVVPEQWSQAAPWPLAGSVEILGFAYPVYRIFLSIAGVVFFFGLWFLQEKTRVGAIIRAGMDDKQMISGMGINYDQVSSAVFLLGSAIGGLSGYLGSPIIGANPSMGINILLLSTIVVIVGGVGYVQGTLFGALIIGLVDALGKAYFPVFALYTPYIVMIVILLIRPAGLLGRDR